MHTNHNLLLDVFWQSGWFNISLLIVTCGIAFFICYINITAKNKRIEELQAKYLQCSELLQYSKQNREDAERLLEEQKDYTTALKSTSGSELRNCLNSITGLVTLMYETDMNEEQKEYAEKMNNACASLLKATDDIFKSKVKEELMINRAQQKAAFLNTHYEHKKLNADFARQFPLQILVAEDDELNSQLMLKILTRLGYTADAVISGQEALEILNEKNYDIIFMDVNMHNMDGLEATRMIRLCLDTQPVIIALTGSVLNADKDKCLKAGMDDYMSKPVDTNELVNMLGKWAVEKDNIVREAVGYKI